VRSPTKKRIAALLGGEGVVSRILSGQQRPKVSREQGVKWVVEAIQEVTPTAKKLRVVLDIENHYKDSVVSMHASDPHLKESVTLD
jgi:sugar phosphate isomerase/epimerase